MRRKGLFIGLLSLGLLSCGPDYSTLAIDVLSSPPIGVNIRDTSISMPVGVAVHVSAVPKSSDHKGYGNERLVLDPEDFGIFQPYTTAHKRRFVFVGVSPGETCMRVIIEGEEEDCIPVVITAQ